MRGDLMPSQSDKLIYERGRNQRPAGFIPSPEGAAMADGLEPQPAGVEQNLSDFGIRIKSRQFADHMRRDECVVGDGNKSQLELSRVKKRLRIGPAPIWAVIAAPQT